MTLEILPTKLNVPPIRQAIISRSRLLVKLSRGLEARAGAFSGKLSLVSAPAGFGKSTLVVDWVTQLAQTSDVAVCWLSLDEQDDNPARFFSYLAAVLQPVNPAWGQLLLGMLQAPERPSPAALMGSLIRDLANTPEPRPPSAAADRQTL